VTGNHEYYNTTREVVNRSLQKVAKKYKNFHWLNNSSVEIDGQRFLGGTMWFPDSREAWVNENRLTDFRVIRGFTKWVYKENKKTQNYLKENMQTGDVVVTHHLPSYYSIADEFEGSDLNCYFVTKMDEVISEKKPAAWFHGHTHASCDYTIGDTAVVCNPYGYKGTNDMNKAFDKTLTIEV
jgi:Icc-related predicted phosphoesterase